VVSRRCWTSTAAPCAIARPARQVSRDAPVPSPSLPARADRADRRSAARTGRTRCMARQVAPPRSAGKLAATITREM
jgi:hypothetical protein